MANMKNVITFRKLLLNESPLAGRTRNKKPTGYHPLLIFFYLFFFNFKRNEIPESGIQVGKLSKIMVERWNNRLLVLFITPFSYFQERRRVYSNKRIYFPIIRHSLYH